MPDPIYPKGPHEAKGYLHGFLEIVLLQAVVSDDGSPLEAGTRGHIVAHLAPDECVSAPDECVLEFSVSDSSMEGGVRIETCLACRDDWTSVDDLQELDDA